MLTAKNLTAKKRGSGQGPADDFDIAEQISGWMAQRDLDFDNAVGRP